MHSNKYLFLIMLLGYSFWQVSKDLSQCNTYLLLYIQNFYIINEKNSFEKEFTNKNGVLLTFSCQVKPYHLSFWQHLDQTIYVCYMHNILFLFCRQYHQYDKIVSRYINTFSISKEWFVEITSNCPHKCLCILTTCTLTATLIFCFFRWFDETINFSLFDILLKSLFTWSTFNAEFFSQVIASSFYAWQKYFSIFICCLTGQYIG